MVLGADAAPSGYRSYVVSVFEPIDDVWKLQLTTHNATPLSRALTLIFSNVSNYPISAAIFIPFPEPSCLFSCPTANDALSGLASAPKNPSTLSTLEIRQLTGFLQRTGTSRPFDANVWKGNHVVIARVFHACGNERYDNCHSQQLALFDTQLYTVPV
jgi:hypothetical protein